MARDLSIHSRNEGTRDPITVTGAGCKLTEIYQQFNENVENILKQYDTVNDLLSIQKEDEAKDIYRTQIVFLESALDYYMHCLSIYAMQQMFSGNWEKTNSYKELKIPIEKVLTALETPENISWLDEAIVIYHSTRSYMSSKEIKSQLTLVSKDDLFKQIADVMYYEQGSTDSTLTKLKDLLNHAFARRNKIVHQADRDHTTGNRFDIIETEVNYFIGEIKRFIDTLHSLLQGS